MSQKPSFDWALMSFDSAATRNASICLNWIISAKDSEPAIAIAISQSDKPALFKYSSPIATLR